MPRSPFLPLLAALAIATCALAGGAFAAAPRAPSPLAWADSLQARAAWAAADTLLDSLAAAARARRDRGAELAALVRIGRGRNELRQPQEAAAILEPLLPELAARRDTLLLCNALLALGRSEGLRSRWEESRARWQRVADLARRARLPAEEGRARIGLGEFAIQSGKASASVREFRRAVRLLSAPGDRRAGLAARAGLARALQETGDLGGARREHERVRAEATALREPHLLANTEFNLGSLEQTSGDPAQAPEHYEAALSLAHQLGRRDLVLRTAQALSILYLLGGQFAAADSVLARALPEAERSRDAGARALLLSQFGVLRREQGRLSEAIEYGRRAVALSETLTVATALSVTPTLVATLGAAGRDEESLEVLRAQRERFGSRLEPDALARLGNSEAQVLLRLGRVREALGKLRAAIGPDAGTALSRESHLQALITLARCRVALGQRDSALAAYARAAAHWEAMRDAQSDPSWRERVDDLAAEFAPAYGVALLEPSRGGSPASRAREAFEALQRFRARTLGERVGAPGVPGNAPPAAPTLATFRARGLRAGEAFLDLYPGSDTTVAFAVSRDTILAWGLGDRAAMAAALGRLRDLVSDPADPTPALRARAAASLGEVLLAPAAALLSRSRRVVVAAGSLARFPLGLLVAPNAREALAVEREAAFVPSAALLVRARSGSAPASRRSLLAVAFAKDDAGRAIPEAPREARWLAARVAATDARLGDARTQAATLAPSFGRYEALHFATHMRENGSRPWQSAMYLGGTRETPSWLTAAEVAKLRAPVALCVLAGCSSVGGQRRVKETLPGLSTAWLAAGARTVVATLWDADDEATRSLVRSFYESLARGATAGEALRSAQRAIRETPKWAAPYYWAGAIVLGDPETRLALKARAAPTAAAPRR